MNATPLSYEEVLSLVKATPTGDGPQHRPRPQDVDPAVSGSHLEEDAIRLKGKPAGDKERPAMMEVQRKRAPVTRATPKHVSVRKPW